ncbi:MAG TPA: tetratricopeptide repeat protein, partial [Thermoflexia bacterium]|nr:tetratricopeptide repeat protein [Thermoflexia bacterium]
MVRYEVRAVPRVEEPEDRRAIFRAARALFRERLAPPDAGFGEVDYDPNALPQTALALLALALLAAYGHRVARSEDEVTVLAALWERWEQARWRRTLRAHGGGPLLEVPEIWREAQDRIERALVAASLGRLFAAPKEVAAWWGAHFPLRTRMADGRQLDSIWLAHRLTALFPAPEGSRWLLPPIVPDPLADVVMARYREGLGDLTAAALPTAEEIKQAGTAARRLAEEAGGPVVIDPVQTPELAVLAWPARLVAEVLPRLSEAAAPGAEEAAKAALETVAGWLEGTAHALPDGVARSWLAAWQGALPHPERTLLLRPFLARFYRLQADRLPEGAATDRAGALNNLGIALSALGRREEALAATKEAVEHYRQLAEANPQAFRPDLAMSLNNLGNVLSALGRREEALAATKEAVDLYRQLAQANPQAFLPYLATSLNNLGAMLSELG